jgi:hypothetical protein
MITLGVIVNKPCNLASSGGAVHNRRIGGRGSIGEEGSPWKW